MPYLKITDLDLEISLTEHEVNHVIGGWSFHRRPRKKKGRKSAQHNIKDNYIPQAIVTVSQGNNGFGTNAGYGNGQQNNSQVNVSF